MLHLEIMSKSLFLGKGTVSILTKQEEHKYIPEVSHVKGLKHNLLRNGQVIHKGYRVYMEDNHCVIKSIHTNNQLIEKVPMTSNHLFPLRIVPENAEAAFKEESK